MYRQHTAPVARDGQSDIRSVPILRPVASGPSRRPVTSAHSQSVLVRASMRHSHSSADREAPDSCFAVPDPCTLAMLGKYNAQSLAKRHHHPQPGRESARLDAWHRATAKSAPSSRPNPRAKRAGRVASTGLDDHATWNRFGTQKRRFEQ